MWDLPRLGLEPVSPALAGGFLTTVPPGKFPEITLESLGPNGVFLTVGEKIFSFFPHGAGLVLLL